MRPSDWVRIECPYCHRARVMRYMTVTRHPDKYGTGFSLCRKCSANPKIPKPPPPPPRTKRVLYTAAHENAARTLPPEPTDAPPGSLQKIAVMKSRFAAGHHMHHPDDARPNMVSRFVAWVEALAQVNAEVAARLTGFAPKNGPPADPQE